jgi:transcriptional regulator with XRE-family HTH domain
MPTPPKTFSDQVRGAVDASGLSRYRICKEIRISEATMSRFMNGKGGLSIASLDRLSALLGLEIVTRPRATKQGG